MECLRLSLPLADGVGREGGAGWIGPWRPDPAERVSVEVWGLPEQRGMRAVRY